MTTDQATRAARFRALHERDEPFLLPNPWDAGTAKLLAGLGFDALATTSLGVALVRGRARATRQEILDNCREVNDATDLPVNADLENGFAHDPADAARMIEDAAAAGMVGASIEDHTGEHDNPIYELGLAVDRVRAAVQTAHALPVPVVLTARCEGFLHGVADLAETISRLQAYEEAGADVLYAPGLRTLADMRSVVSSVGKPVNVVMGFADSTITLDRLAEIGVRRISIGAGFTRIAFKSFMDSARQMKAGRFGFVAEMRPLSELLSSFA